MNYIKTGKVSKLIQILREEAGYLPVHRLIWRIFEHTGYYDYVSAMPAGKARQANPGHAGGKGLRLLRPPATRACLTFIRYIERLKKYNTDFSGRPRAGENDDTVRIMSIHKSKGLNFPWYF